MWNSATANCHGIWCDASQWEKLSCGAQEDTHSCCRMVNACKGKLLFLRLLLSLCTLRREIRNGRKMGKWGHGIESSEVLNIEELLPWSETKSNELLFYLIINHKHLRKNNNNLAGSSSSVNRQWVSPEFRLIKFTTRHQNGDKDGGIRAGVNHTERCSCCTKRRVGREKSIR